MEDMSGNTPVFNYNICSVIRNSLHTCSQKTSGLVGSTCERTRSQHTTAVHLRWSLSEVDVLRHAGE